MIKRMVVFGLFSSFLAFAGDQPPKVDPPPPNGFNLDRLAIVLSVSSLTVGLMESETVQNGVKSIPRLGCLVIKGRLCKTKLQKAIEKIREILEKEEQEEGVTRL